MLQASIDDVVNAAPSIDWSISIRDAAGCGLAGCNLDATMEIASVGKLLLLIEIARQLDEGGLVRDEVLSRNPALQVADSGLWQHLRVDELSINDLCILVASVSDNLATNVLLKHVGLQRVHELSTSLGLTHTALHDYVRDDRGPNDVPTLATGSAGELSLLMSRIFARALISQAVAEQVDAWLATGVDLSMVAAAFGLDPLSHVKSERNMFIRNKTGTDLQIRADVGIVGRGNVWLSYAVIANWRPAEDGMSDVALSGMNAIGQALRRALAIRRH